MKSREEIVETVRKLLALSNDKAATESEALSAALKAQRLVAKHGIDDWELCCEQDPGQIMDVACGKPDGKAVHRILADAVATNFRCKFYIAGRKGSWDVCFYGYEQDAKAAKLTYLYLLDVMKRKARSEVRAAKRAYGSAYGVYNSCCLGFTKGVRDVLEKQSKALMIVVPKEVEDRWDEYTQDMPNASRMRLSTVCEGAQQAFERGRKEARDAIGARAMGQGGQMALCS